MYRKKAFQFVLAVQFDKTHSELQLYGARTEKNKPEKIYRKNTYVQTGNFIKIFTHLFRSIVNLLIDIE